jgi:penicillin-binding protein 2
MVIIEDIERAGAITIEQYVNEYPGLMITTEAKRNYLYGPGCSAITGYIGKISEEELASFKTYGYRMTDLIGRSGLEKQYDAYLRGSYGGMQVEVDSFGRQRDVLDVIEPEKGKDIYLTVDLELQKHCDAVMADRKGCIIAMNPNTGEILALVSKPGYDPNIFLSPKSGKEIVRILNEKSRAYPLLNRAISCAYPPGSVFKLVVASAALESGRFTKTNTLSCSGQFNLSGALFRCWKEEGHGVQNIYEGIKNSCNVFFYQLGLKAGVDNIFSFAKRFGFGSLTNIDLPAEKKGTVPNPQWKRITMREQWYAGDTVNYAIGQGYLLVTPIQVARMISSFANGGYLVRPYLVEKLENVKASHRSIEKIGISDVTIDTVREGIRRVVNDPTGTGMKARLADIVVAGKTGTAQNPLGKSHGWFAGFAPFDNAKISVVVFVEFGGKGGLEASIMARKVIEKAKEIGLI